MIVAGIHAVMAVLEDPGSKVVELLIAEGRTGERIESLQAVATARKCLIRSVSKAELDEQSAGVHQGVILVVEPPGLLSERFLEDLVADHADGTTRAQLALLLLDGVTDPRNLGACVRSAAALGVDAVVIPKRRSAGLNPAALKAASGGMARVPLVQVTNLKRTVRQLQQANVWVVGLDGEADAVLNEVDMTGRIALIMGSEGEGMRRLTESACDYLARIPTGGSSLNVSVAAGIALYEMARQRAVKASAG